MNDYTRTPKLPPDVKWKQKDDELPHEYQDELGRPKLAVLREYAYHANGLPVINPETGKQWKRCPQRWWGCRDFKKPPGARALLYKLPELIQAIAAKKDIYIVEGEPKVTLLQNWGLSATCAPGGAGNWTAEHSELLRGASRIIILPDNDEVGKKHADKIGRTTENVVHARCLLELPHLPERGDVIDWQRNGGTKELFLEQPFLQWVPYYEEDTNPLGVWDAGDDVEKPPPRGWLYGNIFARKFFSSLFGDGGVGKTALRYAQLLSLAIGKSLTGDHVFQRCRVLIISLEDDADELRRRILWHCEFITGFHTMTSKAGCSCPRRVRLVAS